MRPIKAIPETGAQFEVSHPFVRGTFLFRDVDGSCEAPTWTPGLRNEILPCGDDVESVADAIGKQILTVIGTYKPGKYPTRVFYTRQWVDPAGKRFGKANCRITTLGAFRSLVRGYRVAFRLVGRPKREATA